MKRINMLKKITIALFLLLLLLPKTVFCSEMEEYIDEFPILALKIDEVNTDMHYFLGWDFENKEYMQKQSVESIEKFDSFKTQLDELSLPIELWVLRDKMKAYINALESVYTGIEAKDTEILDKEFAAIDKPIMEYVAELRKVVSQYNSLDDFNNEELKSIDEENKLADNDEDRQKYKQAVDLIKARKFTQAYDILKLLAAKYKNKDFRYCLLLRQSDCLLFTDSKVAKKIDKQVSESEKETVNSTEQGLLMLTEIVNAKVYLPILSVAFYKWRTMEQHYNGGASNMSVIPNDEYNVKRWEIVKLLQNRLKDYPQERWARIQTMLLLDLSNINRGGPYGNTNLIHHAQLYTDILNKTEKINAEQIKDTSN